MSTEKKQSTRQNGYINPKAYHNKLQDYFDMMVKEKKCALVPQSKVIGNFAGLTYKFLDGPSKGHWAQLAVPMRSTETRPTYYKEFDPDTKQFVKTDLVYDRTTKKYVHTGEPKDKINNIFDAIAVTNGMVNNRENFSKIKNIAIARLGRYDGQQIGDYDQKTDDKARDQKSKEDGLTQEEIAFSQKVREGELALMISTMIGEIEKTGTLYGKKAMQVPIKISASNVAHSENNQFPSRAMALESECTEKNRKTGQWKYNGPVLGGLQYVAAMQAGMEDNRYMLESDIKNVTDPTRIVNGKPKVLKYAPIRSTHESNHPNCKKIYGNNYLTPNYVYGKDIGMRQILGKDKKPVPEDQLTLHCVYIDYDRKPHLTIQNYVNIANLAEKPIGTLEDDHSQDETIYPRYLAKGTNQNGFLNKATSLYGKSILDKEAFRKDPIATMRNIITEFTPNHELRNQGMRALQRELTLDRVMRRCGYQEGIEIPAEDRKAIVEWLSKDLNNENKAEIGRHFMNAMTAMDRNNAFLMGASREEILNQVKEVEKRPKFKNVKLEMLSDYRMENGKVLPAGAGGPLSMTLSGENAYTILRDICHKDKTLYTEPTNEDYHKKVRFNLKLGDIEYKDISLSLGNLDTGNVNTVAESIANLITKDSKEQAYQRDSINKEFGKMKALEAAGLLRDDLKHVDRVDVAAKQRFAYNAEKEKAWEALKDFKLDEETYNRLKKVAGEEIPQDLSKEADVYRYKVPTQNTTLLYEALGTSNIVRIVEPKEQALKLDDKESLVVELRRPLEPLKYTDKNGTLMNRMDKSGKIPTFYDSAEARRRGTATLEAVPYLKGEEYGKNEDFKKKFSLDVISLGENGEELGTITRKGAAGRDLMLQMADRDEKAWQMEKEGRRSIYNMDPYKIVAKWDNEPVFEAKGRFGEKAFSNGRSLEEVLSSQADTLSDKGKEALNELLDKSVVQQKYSRDLDMGLAMGSNEPVTAKEVQKVVSANKKVADLTPEMAASRVDRLEIEARVNMKKTNEEVMNYIVDASIKESKARTPQQLQAIQNEIAEARPEQKDLVTKSMAREEVQKKMTSRGAHR